MTTESQDKEKNISIPVSNINNYIYLQYLLNVTAREFLRGYFRRLWFLLQDCNQDWTWDTCPQSSRIFINVFGNKLYRLSTAIQKNLLEIGNINRWDLFLLLKAVQCLEDNVKNIQKDLAVCPSPKDYRNLASFWNELRLSKMAQMDDKKFQTLWGEALTILSAVGIPETDIQLAKSRLNLKIDEKPKGVAVGAGEKLNKKGDMLFKKKNFQEAIQAYSEALEQQDGSAELLGIIYFNRSVAYYKTGDFENSKADGEEAISYLPHWWRGYARVALAEMELKNYEKAIFYLDVVLALQPTIKEFKEQRDLCLKKLFPEPELEIVPEPETKPTDSTAEIIIVNESIEFSTTSHVDMFKEHTTDWAVLSHIEWPKDRPKEIIAEVASEDSSMILGDALSMVSRKELEELATREATSTVEKAINEFTAIVNGMNGKMAEIEEKTTSLLQRTLQVIVKSNVVETPPKKKNNNNKKKNTKNKSKDKEREEEGAQKKGKAEREDFRKNLKQFFAQNTTETCATKILNAYELYLGKNSKLVPLSKDFRKQVIIAHRFLLKDEGGAGGAKALKGLGGFRLEFRISQSKKEITSKAGNASVIRLNGLEEMRFPDLDLTKTDHTYTGFFIELTVIEDPISTPNIVATVVENFNDYNSALLMIINVSKLQEEKYKNGLESLDYGNVIKVANPRFVMVKSQVVLRVDDMSMVVPVREIINRCRYCGVDSGAGRGRHTCWCTKCLRVSYCSDLCRRLDEGILGHWQLCSYFNRHFF